MHYIHTIHPLHTHIHAYHVYITCKTCISCITCISCTTCISNTPQRSNMYYTNHINIIYDISCRTLTYQTCQAYQTCMHAMHYVTSHRITSHHITLHYVHCIALHCITVHYIAVPEAGETKASRFFISQSIYGPFRA